MRSASERFPFSATGCPSEDGHVVAAAQHERFLGEKRHAGFPVDADRDGPFMTQIVALRRERRRTVPAVTHADGTARLQIVSAAQRPLHHQLIAAFASQTGVPMVLNASQNESEPIVRDPGAAIACCLRTRMDRVMLGSHIIARPASGK